MRVREPLDQALEAATLALGGVRRIEGRFASIELRSGAPSPERLAPLGYLCSGLLGISVVLVLWFL